MNYLCAFVQEHAMADVEKQPLIGKTVDNIKQGAPAVKSTLAPHFAGLSMTTIIILYYALCSSTMLVSYNAGLCAANLDRLDMFSSFSFR